MSRIRVAFIAAWIASLIPLVATPSRAAKVWIARDSGGVHASRPTVEDASACALGAMPHTTMAAACSTGPTLTIGGTTALANPCSATQATTASIPDDVTTFQGIVNQSTIGER